MSRMDSREAGLLLAQQLFKVDDLHYGWWEEGDQISLVNLPAAQDRYNAVLLEAIGRHVTTGRVLDIGCGTGKLLALLLRRGYQAEGVIPSATLHRMVRQRLCGEGRDQARVFECRFEDFPAADHAAAYDVAIFSESFQYIPMDRAFAMLGQIMRPRALVLICDFFRRDLSAAESEGSFGGGHRLSSLYPAMQRARLTVLGDTDVTARMSPNLALVDDLLMNRLRPAVDTIGTYVSSRRPWLARGLGWLFRHRIAKIRRKYLSGDRNQALFERTKNYRLLLLQMPA